ncbi:hypothetical protein Y032_0265g653 [Ancylostoma ceylanicum]|uniref:Peptidase M13 N-terminal domain-containing protein n=1 Tax=Ancylostoma ceylanicum TaxID=53326 RepID=A0A016SAB1_9BILA|nr:hypothetical protein Y032_0265g653 [Ancylostoma ceylanicum]
MALDRVMQGKKQKAPRWRHCTTKTMGRMQYAAGAMYVMKAFDQASKNVTQEMIGDLLEAFRQMVLTNDWMDAKTKASALDKAGQMLQHIAYPDFILDDQKLDDYYSGFNVLDSDSYSQMVGKLSRWNLVHEFKRLIEPVDRNEFDFNAAVVNAYYQPTSNSIKFPAAILQSPFFHHTFPSSTVTSVELSGSRSLACSGIYCVLLERKTISARFVERGKSHLLLGSQGAPTKMS